jgi:hypothetical protein
MTMMVSLHVQIPILQKRFNGPGPSSNVGTHFHAQAGGDPAEAPVELVWGGVVAVEDDEETNEEAEDSERRDDGSGNFVVGKG